MFVKGNVSVKRKSRRGRLVDHEGRQRHVRKGEQVRNMPVAVAVWMGGGSVAKLVRLGQRRGGLK